ncbi:hypothetical protein BJY01DRAFT_201989 [Aspergillus pseudoustus]|uniref:Uncharacterized protein n=1 Tax=Aspergillus pseudoustus TaxID=1810923 RepID=A0ABR4L067_9EURO
MRLLAIILRVRHTRICKHPNTRNLLFAPLLAHGSIQGCGGSDATRGLEHHKSHELRDAPNNLVKPSSSDLGSIAQPVIACPNQWHCHQIAQQVICISCPLLYVAGPQHGCPSADGCPPSPSHTRSVHPPS